MVDLDLAPFSQQLVERGPRDAPFHNVCRILLSDPCSEGAPLATRKEGTCLHAHVPCIPTYRHDHGRPFVANAQPSWDNPSPLTVVDFLPHIRTNVLAQTFARRGRLTRLCKNTLVVR